MDLKKLKSKDKSTGKGRKGKLSSFKLQISYSLSTENKNSMVWSASIFGPLKKEIKKKILEQAW